MRVLHVDTGSEWRGGQTQVMRLALGMVERGVEVGVACPPEGRLWAELAALGDRRLPIPAGWSLRTSLAIWRDRPDLVVAHTSHAHGCCALTPLPLVVHRWVDFPVKRGWRGTRWKYRRPQAYAAITVAVKQILESAGCTNVEVVHAGVDPAPEAPPASDGPEVLAIGARVAHKGHEILAAAAAGLPGVDIGVAGEGPLLFEGLRYLGHREDVPALLAAAKVLVHPSHTEGQGLAIVEAMHAGVPVVATAVGGIPEVVGDAGILVPPGDPDALAAGIRRALDGEHPSVATARERAMRFSVDALVEDSIGLYRRVLESQPVDGPGVG